MSIKSSMSLRRLSGIALTLLFVGSFCFGRADAQTAPTMSQPTAAQIQASAPSFQMPAAFQGTLGNGTGYLVLSQETGADAVYDGSENTWLYNYPVTVTDNGAPLSCVPVYSSTNPSQTSLLRQNCGSVSYQLSSGLEDCPSYALKADPVDVSSTDGSAPFKASCLEVNDSNTSIPDLMTFYTVTPVYSPIDAENDPANPYYLPVSGSPVNFWALRNPMVQISSSPASLTVAAGSSAQATLTLTSVLGYGYAGRASTLNNYGMPLALACEGLPAYATCSFTYPAPSNSDPNQVGSACASGSAQEYCGVDVGPPAGTVLAGGSSCTASNGCIGPGTVTMTINTNVATGEQSRLRRDPGSFAFAAMLGLGLLGLGFRKRAQKWGGLLVLGCVLLCGGGMIGITACSTTNLSPNSTPVTPAGTYNVSVVASETGFICLANTVNPGESVSPCGSTASTTGDAPTWGNGNQMSLPYTISVTFTK